MQLQRPIVFFDLETTGLSLSSDRIIEISMIKLNPDDTTQKYYSRVNPEGKNIEEGAFKKHGVKLEDLEEFPIFKNIAKDVFDFIKDCDLGGYNCKRFDIPILIEEFLRCNILINIKDFNIIDVFKILNKVEPRTLEGTYKRFLGKEMENAHHAESDIIATIEILEEIEKQYNIPSNPSELYKYSEDEETFDLEGKLKKTERGVIFNFGKYKDKTIEEVFKIDPSYYNWLIEKTDMTRYTKIIFKNILTYLKNKNNDK